MMFILLLPLLACTKSPESSMKDPTEQTAVRPDNPKDPLNGAMQRIYDAAPPCLGPQASVAVLRTTDGAVHRLYYHGDLMRCSHPPSIYYSPSGEQLEVVAEEPLTDENREHYTQLHARHRPAGTTSSPSENRYFR